MIFLTPTIMHTGTHLLKHEIFKGVRDVPQSGPKGDYDYQVGVHLTDTTKEFLKGWFDKGYPIITTLRHPARVRASFVNRGRPITLEDEKEIKPIVLPEHLRKLVVNPPKEDLRGVCYETQWKNLIEMCENYSVEIIHIDDFENRDQQVLELGKKLNRTLYTDWPLAKNSGSYTNTHNLEVTEEMVNEIPGWIMDFYNHTLSYKDISANVA